MALLFMIFAHIVDDYYLQGWLASAKQKQYLVNLPSYTDKYKFDFLAALLMHAFSWTFMIMLPAAVLNKFDVSALFYLAFFANMCIHAITDHLKANIKAINLVQDQLIHIIQIVITFVCLPYFSIG